MVRKKNKLYTVNKWNHPMFMPEEEKGNLFAVGGNRGINVNALNTPLSNPGKVLGISTPQKTNQGITNPYVKGTVNQGLSTPGWVSNTSSGLNYKAPQLSQPKLSTPVNWDNAGERTKAVTETNNLVNNFGKEADANNPFKKILNSGNGDNSSGASAPGWAGAAKAAGAAAASMADSVYKSEDNPRGLYDVMDPVHQMAGGRESEAGNALEDTGVSIFKAGAQSGNGYTMMLGAGVKILGGLGNAAFGIKTDKARLSAINSGLDYLKNFNSDASYYDDIEGLRSFVDNTDGVYEGGWFTGGKARRKNAELAFQVNDWKGYGNRSIWNNIHNIDRNQMDILRHNWHAFGGPLDSQGSGAVNYNFMSDYLTMRNRANENRNKVSTNVFGNLPVTPLSTFALGGDMQTNGSDWSNGLSHIDAGGTHEQNPYQGVQVGINRENGQPDLAEEGETIFDDYVFPRRIKPDAKTKKKFHVSKNSDMSYADLSKKIAKESEERPNDAVSQAGLKKQLHELADELERQKEEKQKAEMEAAFAQLPPEQQQAIMQQVAMQEQQAEQQAIQGQQMPEEAMAQQEPQQQVDEQMMQQQPEMAQMEGQPGEEVQMAACGGKINRYDDGGELRTAIYKALGFYTDSQFDKWAKENNLKDIDWKTAKENKALWDAIGNKGAALKDAIGRGYNFGSYKPAPNKLTFDFKHGGWGLENYDAWNGSTDAAWQEAVKKGLVKEGMNSEEIGKALSQTDAYKRGSDWLKSDEKNRLLYLQSILNSTDAPQAARDYAAKYVDANGWLNGSKRDYQTIFEDPDGTGVRNTHPGTYWKTPNEVLRGKQSTYLVVNDDGTVEEIRGDVPKDLQLSDSYSWQDENNDNSVFYYTKPAAKDAAKTKDGKPVEENKEYDPIIKDEWGRYVGVYSPLVNLGLMTAGVGKPDYSGMEAAVAAASGAPAQAHTRFLGNYIGYNPMDIWYEQNRLNANSRATDRAILNNNSTIGTKTAGLLANSYNSQMASGNLFRQALEYNDAQRQKVADFNRGTDQFNATAFNQTSATNAQLRNSQRNFQAQMMMNAAKEKLDTDASWYNSLYGNISKLGDNLAGWGRENAQHNMIARMAADGIFGNATDKTHTFQDFITERKKTTKAAEGGKVSRRKGRRGLTF